LPAEQRQDPRLNVTRAVAADRLGDYKLMQRESEIAIQLGESQNARQKLVYTQNHQIYLANWDGTNSHELVTIAGFPIYARFSADGTHIRYSASAPDRYTLWEICTNWELLASGRL
jgi:hypothetical protein